MVFRWLGLVVGSSMRYSAAPVSFAVNVLLRMCLMSSFLEMMFGLSAYPRKMLGRSGLLPYLVLAKLVFLLLCIIIIWNA